MRAFEARGDVAVAELDAEERAVVARVIADVGLLLDGEAFGAQREESEDPEEELFRHLRGFEAALSDPEDPAVLRILPNAAPDDREVAEEFRRLTEPELRATKVDRLRAIWEALNEDGPEWEVQEADALATAAALTDVRLVLAARLGLETDADADVLHHEIERAERSDRAGDSPVTAVNPERVWLGMLYQALTWLQESLMTYVMRDDV
ncbi:DUF2017 domain-containing protein [Demequina sp. TTPB684]|uniref:DUF2017 family protein n=1 Tax=unclassified Demequina TaxID=2620311 RepID=UPI001CF2C1E1|nr:DUF2017 family protein [Demequina sp. TMPB413]MCB2413493.1 DUF2017 domain-containing protein [Demequina sp. TTPB684]UPU87187.1 DUF2017 domain-containing protein [Demequina sp. TMPB413]